MKHMRLFLSFFSLFAFYYVTAFETPSVQLQKMNTCLCSEKKLNFFTVLEMLKHLTVS